MKSNIVIKRIYRLICIFIVLFTIFSSVNYTYANTENTRDQSISGIIQDGSSFIELRRRTRISNSTKRYSNFIK